MPRSATGLNTVTKRGSDGTLIEVRYYDRESRAFIGSSRDGWTKEAAMSVVRSAASEAKQSEPRAGSFGWLVASYLASSRFSKRKPRTQGEYRRHLTAFRAAWEDRPAEAIGRSDVARWLADRAATPWEANGDVRVLRLLYAWGHKELGLATNPADAPELFATPPRTKIWDGDRIGRLLDAADGDAAGKRLRLACALLLFTVQRPSDVLAMTVGQVVDHGDRLWIVLRQAKTEELMAVPCHRDLERELKAAGEENWRAGREGRPASMLLVPSPTGRQWRYRNFARAWDRVRRRANIRVARKTLREWGGLPPVANPRQRAAAKATLRTRLLTDLQRRDLRRTGMVQLALAGATVPQIAALSGHSIDQTAKIVETYVPRRGEVALSGVELWESGVRRSVALPLHAVFGAQRPEISTGNR